MARLTARGNPGRRGENVTKLAARRDPTSPRLVPPLRTRRAAPRRTRGRQRGGSANGGNREGEARGERKRPSDGNLATAFMAFVRDRLETALRSAARRDVADEGVDKGASERASRVRHGGPASGMHIPKTKPGRESCQPSERTSKRASERVSEKKSGKTSGYTAFSARSSHLTRRYVTFYA